MLVVDVSGSMQSNPPNGNQSKWVITRDALAVAMDSLPATTAVGIIYYPNLGNTGTGTQPRPTSACVNTNAMIPIDLLGAAGSPHRGRIAQSLQSARTGGGTPTHDAYQYAVQNGMIPSMHTGNRFMLLITDGQPTFSLQCIGTGATSNPVPEQPIVDEIGAAHGQGIRTFVIGSPGSEQNVSTGADARPWLSRAANAGNTATPGCSDTGPNFCHMDMTQAPDFAAALRSGLAQIAGTLVSCTYDLPQPPAGQQLDLSKVNVINTPGGGPPTILPRSDDPNCTEGWYLDSNNRVVLCSETCAQVQADPQVGLEVLYGCKSVGPGPRRSLALHARLAEDRATGLEVCMKAPDGGDVDVSDLEEELIILPRSIRYFLSDRGGVDLPHTPSQTTASSRTVSRTFTRSCHGPTSAWSCRSTA